MVPLYLSDIRSFVRAKLDEVSSDAGFIATDNLDIAKIVEDSAVLVIRTVHLSAPNVLLDGELLANVSLTVDRDNVGYISVPRNFMRLVSLQVNGWSRPVQTLISEDSVEYRKQQNKYLRGTLRNPVAAITHKGSDERHVIELYVCPANASVSHFRYVPEIELINNNTTIMICPKLKQACLYAVTAEVMRCYNEPNKAQMFEALAQRALNPTMDNERLYPTNGEKTIE